MWKIRASRRFLTNLLIISAILFNVQLINAEINNYNNNSIYTNLPDLIPNEDAIINSNQTTVIVPVSTPLIEEVEIQSTSVNTLKSTTQIQEDQTHIINNQVGTTEETTNTIEFNIKHEISNPTFIPAIESRVMPVTENSNPPLFSIADTKFAQLDMNELPIKIQKCCPSGQIMVLGQPGEKSICQVSNEDFDMPVFHSNSTHYWNFTSTASSDVEIVDRDPCKQSKFFLDPNDDSDIFRILSNSSLYLPCSFDMLNIDQYCVDTIKGSDTIFTTAVICTSPPKANVVHFLYIAGLLISVVSLILLTIYTLRRNDIKEDHKKCLAFFAGAMAIAYLIITLQTSFHNYFNHIINLIIAYLIYYLNLNYYLWLNMLLVDIYICVRGSNNDTISYMKRYLTATSLIPLSFVFVSFFNGFNPPLPNLYLEHKFSSSYWTIVILYIVPVIFSTVLNFILGCCSSLPKERYTNVKDLITTFQSDGWKAPPRNINEIKQIYRRTLGLCLIVFSCFIFDMVLFFLPSTGTQQIHFVIRDTIYCLQGFLVGLVYLKMNRCCKCSKRNIITNNETELMPMTNGIV